MTMTLNRSAYEKLIDEDIQWLLSQPRTLERDHIETIVRASADLEYDRIEAAGELLISLPEPGTDMAKVMTANRLLRQKLADTQQRETILRCALEVLCGVTGSEEDRSIQTLVGIIKILEQLPASENKSAALNGIEALIVTHPHRQRELAREVTARNERTA